MFKDRTVKEDDKKNSSTSIKPEYEKMLKDPDFILLIKQQFQDEFDKERELLKLNFGEAFVTLKDTYINKGNPKTSKDGSAIVDGAGQVEKWPDRYYLTFSSQSFGNKQFEVKLSLFEQFKDNLGEDFILSYELIEDGYNPKNISLKVKELITLTEYKNREYGVKSEDIPFN